MHSMNVNNLSVQNLFFPLHDVLLFKDMGSIKHKICNKV
jgi:hypothetical protein